MNPRYLAGRLIALTYAVVICCACVYVMYVMGLR